MKPAAALLLALIAAAAQTPARAQAPERVWSVETPKDAEAALHFGAPDTDDQPIAFFCTRKSGQVKVVADLSAQLGVDQVGGAWVDKARPELYSLSCSSRAAFARISSSIAWPGTGSVSRRFRSASQPIDA